VRHLRQYARTIVHAVLYQQSPENRERVVFFLMLSWRSNDRREKGMESFTVSRQNCMGDMLKEKS
jgi:hypothetical protein